MRVVIIGGGAAGMMCAATINELQPRAEVVLIEKNPILGKKVLISGGGRCNVTTGLQDIKEVLKKYPRGNKFLTSALYHFSPALVQEWFEAHGVALKCESDQRVFPASDKGEDVVQAFASVFARFSTQVWLNHQVVSIKKKNNIFAVCFKTQASLEADVVVLALGGQAYRQTGSTGDGYTLAEALGHTVTPLAPSLHSFIVVEEWPRRLAGISLGRASLTAHATPPQSFTGPILFTHRGVSGPAVFALSSLAAFAPLEVKKPLLLTLDVFPDETSEVLSDRLQASAHSHPKQSFKNILRAFVPEAVAELVCEKNTIDETAKAGEISKMLVRQVATWMKAMPLHAVARGAGDEFVTAGGVELSEVDQRTMESKLCPGLYFAGEILNIDGFTGGFNLQAAWATGRVAGEAICTLLLPVE